MDAGKIEIFGIHLIDFKMVKGLLESRYSKNYGKENLGKWDELGRVGN